jgi:hypothetical protein
MRADKTQNGRDAGGAPATLDFLDFADFSIDFAKLWW